jgi:predicted short-subunit dehydrogenase-like oxidoreductase (DUF2520 family)
LTSNTELREPIGIAGSGRVAQSLGRLLLQQGEHVACVASRDPEHAARAAAFIGSGVEPVSLAELSRKTLRFILAVPDGALPAVIRTLAKSAERGAIALHTSGVRDIEDFPPLQDVGATCGTFHPLQSISDPMQGCADLRGATFAISGQPAAVGWARHLAGLLEGRAVEIPPGRRPLYHAAAAMASNYSVALLDAASELMAEAADTTREDALRLLAPLVRVSVNNTLERGAEAALTGPIERGDAGTVALHITAISFAPERIRHLYAAADCRRWPLRAGEACPHPLRMKLNCFSERQLDE